MAIKITSNDNYIKVDCDSYVLAKDYAETYEMICDAYFKHFRYIEKFIIHEQVIDAIVSNVNSVLSLKFELSENMRLFGIKVESFKP